MLEVTPVVTGTPRSTFWYFVKELYCISGKHSGAESGATVTVGAARKLRHILMQHGWELRSTAFNFCGLSHICLALCPVCSRVSGEAIV